MSATADPLSDPELLETAWDLGPLVDGDEAGRRRPPARRGLAPPAYLPTATPASRELDGDGSRGDARAGARSTSWSAGAASYASLRFSTDTADPTRGALLQRVQERATEIETKLLFFELEWAALDDERAEELLGGDALDFCAHHLRSARRYRPHLLSEPEEKVLAEKCDLQSERLGAAVRRAGLGAPGDAGTARRSRSSWR